MIEILAAMMFILLYAVLCTMYIGRNTIFEKLFRAEFVGLKFDI